MGYSPWRRKEWDTTEQLNNNKAPFRERKTCQHILKITGTLPFEYANTENRPYKLSKVSYFLMCTPQLDCSEMFTELYREEKKEAGDRGGQKDKRGK